MRDEAVLEQLVAQADARAADFSDLRAVIEAASEAGAVRALERLGLTDEGAREDVRELRQLLSVWRDAKKSVWKALIDWLVRGSLALLLVGIAVKLGLGGMLR
jgi:hypothetical protein